MNDLTFGATLLFCLAMMVAAVIVEVTAVSGRPGAAVSRPGVVAAQASKSVAKDCTTVAMAPAAAGR